jgi:hypothetical protein
MKNDFYSTYIPGSYAIEIDTLTCQQKLSQEDRKSALQWLFLSAWINPQIPKEMII